MMSSEFNVTSGGTAQHDHPAAVYNSTDDEYLVVYHNSPTGTTEDVAAQRVDASDGSLLSNRNIATGESEIRHYPDVGSGTPQGSSTGFHIAGNITSYVNLLPVVDYGSGFGYLVSWQYDSSGSYTNYDIYARYVRPGQDSAMGTWFIVDNFSYDQEYPAVACAPSGDCLIAEQDNYPF
jgi:hypothetical protein